MMRIRPYVPLPFDRLRDPAFCAFLQTPTCSTFWLIGARVMACTSTLEPGSDIPDLTDLCRLGDDERWVGIIPSRDTHVPTDLPERGWLCAEVSTEQLQMRLPERSLELIEADIDQLAAMGLLEIHRVMLNGKETRVLKLGEWHIDELFSSC